MKSAGTASPRESELEIAGEIAQAFLAASTPIELYRLVLAQLTPLVRANFSSVFLRDPDEPTLLKLLCAHNWPQASARYLGQLRLRVGRGPTGSAVAESRAFEVSDVFADPELSDWWEPARELGFKSLISLPLRTADETAGALTFYFEHAHVFSQDERHVLGMVADKLAVTAARAESAVTLRRELENLRADNARLQERAAESAQAKRLKEEFLSNISHELRTPLTSILGYANLLTSGVAGPLSANHMKLIERIETSGNVLLTLITDLLELSELRIGQSQANLAPDDAVMLAQRALEAAGSPREGVAVTFVGGEQSLPLLTDGEKVVKVITNLLTNAFKFTEQGSVTLSVSQVRDGETSAIEWVVRDTGIGVPASERDTIFDEFRQVDGSSTRSHGGTGTGLALSRALAGVLGGSLRVSVESGSGAEFTFRVPAT